MKVLLVGIDRDIIYMTGKILRRKQFDVLYAIGQSEASQMLEANRFDLIIIDCDMSELEYNQIITNVKNTINHPRLLLLSSNREDEVPLLKAGADDWIHKPYQMDVLLARMEALLR